MLHPIFSTLINRPDLVADHAAAYAELIRQEATDLGAQWQRRVIAWVAVSLGLLAFLILGGVALMLLAVHTFHWTFALVPGLVLMPTLWAFSIARSPSTALTCPDLMSQVQNDIKALREAVK